MKFFSCEKNYVSTQFFLEFDRRNFKLQKKISTGFLKLFSKCPEEGFQDKPISSWENCVFSSISDFEERLIRTFESNNC